MLEFIICIVIVVATALVLILFSNSKPIKYDDDYEVDAFWAGLGMPIRRRKRRN